MRDVVALSLGHNSSAILIRDGHIVVGYEEERFTRVKSDSSFPINAINKIRYEYKPENPTVIASHWFLNGTLDTNDKHWRPDLVPGDWNIMDIDFNHYSHHDAHMDSALVFAGDDFPMRTHILVMDGFGTRGEHTTMYHRDANGIVRQQFRVYGFLHSVGLFYQYATKYCGMKMNNHEYKMLAYETRIKDVLPQDNTIYALNDRIDAFSLVVKEDMVNNQVKETDLNNLKATERFVFTALDNTITWLYGDQPVSPKTKKIVTSYFAQRHLENVVLSMVDGIDVTNLIVVGGVFYNVKINHLLCNKVPGMFCAMPLAGDQGASIGLYSRMFKKVHWPNHLFWGHRKFDEIRLDRTPEMTVARGVDEFYYFVRKYLKAYSRVNVLRGAMEFGPRAMCNTSTLALPTVQNTIAINTMNDRTTEMPFGLVVSPEQAKKMFVKPGKVHRSLEYMIMAREVHDHVAVKVEYGCHWYPLEQKWTCRPQVTEDLAMVSLLDEFGPLINTSWNFHGVPIVYDTESALYTHKMEQEHCVMPIKTVVLMEG